MSRRLSFLKPLVVAALFASAHVAAGGVTDSTALAKWDIVADAAWEANLSNKGLYSLTVLGEFTHPPAGPTFTTDTTVGLKDKLLGASSMGGLVTDGDSPARAEGVVDIFDVEIGAATFSYAYTITATATDAAPDHLAKAQATMNDPIPLKIGDPNGQLVNTPTLRSGAQVQQRHVDDATGPTRLTLRGRFGQGAFDGGAGDGPRPAIFWTAPPPSGAFDLYEVSIYEGVGGTIEADVALFDSPNPDYTVAFNMSAAEIKAAVENAGWALDSENHWVLPADLALVEVTIAATTATNLGADGAIGVLTSAEAFSGGTDGPPPPSLPAVSDKGMIALAVLAAACGALLIRLRRPE